MKHYLLAAALTAVPTLAQTGLPAGHEAAAPFVGASVVMVHTPSAAKTARASVRRALRAAGYDLTEQEKVPGIRTLARQLGGGLSLAVEVTVVTQGSGSVVAFRGVYSLRPGRPGAMVRYLPAQCSDAPDSLSQRTWEEVRQVALAALPGAQVSYQ